MAAVHGLDAPHHHFALLRLGHRLHYWYVRFHHIVVDGLGGAVFARTVADLYERAVRGENLAEAELPAAPLRELVADEVAYRGSERYEADRTYWTDRFADLVTDPAVDPAGAEGEADAHGGRALVQPAHRRRAAGPRRTGHPAAHRRDASRRRLRQSAAGSPPPTAPPGAPSSSVPSPRT